MDFSRASRLYFHAAIYKCYDDFNRSNGKVVTLQNGTQMNMAKAIILAIFVTIQLPANVACVGQRVLNALLAYAILRNHPSVFPCSCEHPGT